jgi:flagellin
MALRIYNNLHSNTAQKNLGVNSANLARSLERLSSGLRINRAKDDAAGLAISEGLRADIAAMGQASRNANDGIALLNTAEGALTEQSSILIRMRELASQSATGTVGSTERATLSNEFNALRSEIDRIASVAAFGSVSLLDGSLSSAAGVASIVIQVGISNSANDRISINAGVNLTAMNSTALQIDTLSISSVAGALSAIGSIGSAISTVSSGRGSLGAVQSRLTYAINNLSTMEENLRAAESQIRDADYAAEISEFTKNQILVQASTAILAQANLLPQSVLQLLA